MTAPTADAAALAAPPVGGRLWRSPGLVPLFTASTTARLANEAARVALVLLVLDRTGSPALAGTVVGALALPALVTGPLLGAWLDRTARRRSAFVVNQVLLLGALVALLAVTGRAPGGVVVGLALLAGLAMPVLTGGFTGLIAPLVRPSLLRRAYGAEATSYNTAAVGGPALAGALAGLVDPAAAVAAAAAVSGLALLAVLRVPMPPPAPAAAAASLLRTVWAGVRHLATTPALRSITVATTLAFAGFGALPVVFPLLAEDLGASRATGGLLFSVFALGALAGSVLVATRSPRTGPMRVAYACLVGIAGVWAAVALAPTLPIAVAMVFVAGALEGPVLASTLAVRELHSPAAMRTQIVTTAASLKFGAFALGAALAGAVAAAAGPRSGLVVASGAAALGVVAGLMSARGLHRR